MSIVRRARAQWKVISAWGGLAVVLATGPLSFLLAWWLVPPAIVGIYLAVAVLVLVVDVIRRRSSEEDELARPLAGGGEQLVREQNLVAREGAGFWWKADVARWFDGYFALWRIREGVRASNIELRVEGPYLRDVLDHDAAPPEGEFVHRRKAALIGPAGDWLSDEESVLRVQRHDWDLAQWCEANLENVLERNKVSAFGAVAGDEPWTPLPAILCAHTVIETADGWVLFCLRRRKAAYHPLTWSVSFEEQIELGPLLDESGVVVRAQMDRTIGETVVRGLGEEFGLGGAVRSMMTLALGVEVAREKGRQIMAPAVVTAARLDIPLKGVWTALDGCDRVRDRAEHVAWMACRFVSRGDVLQLLKQTRPGVAPAIGPSLLRDHISLSTQVAEYHGSVDADVRDAAYAWHPTSRARLQLWADYAQARGRLR